MLDHLRIDSRIAEIRKRLLILEEIANTTTEASFTEDEDFIGSAGERNLEIAIQACLDIASHIVAQLALEKPKENKDLFDILAKHKIISFDMAKKMMPVTGMRNILVHEYLEIQPDKVYHVIKNELKDISAYIREIEIFLDKQSRL